MAAPTADEDAAFSSDAGPEDLPPEARALGPKLLPWMLGGYLFLVAFGYAALRHTGVMVQGQELAYDRAMFLSTSAATLTGFQQSIGATEFNHASTQGPAVLLTLTVLGSLLSLAVGGLAAVRALRLPYTDAQVIASALTVEFLAVLAGTAFLAGGGRSLFDAMQLAACAFGNSGAFTGRLPDLFGARTHLLLLPLSILGGLGLPVLMEIYDRVFGIRRLSAHSRTALTWTAGVYLVSIVILFVLLPSSDARHRLALGSAAALNARTAGFPFDQFVNHLPRTAQWFVAALMVVGACPAGTAGGLKVTTFPVLYRGFCAALAGRRVPRAAAVAGVGVALYTLFALGGFLLLLASEPQMPADRTLFLVLSAASNVGLSHDPVTVVGPGLYVLSLLMLLGRLTPLLLLWWLASFREKCDVLVG